ncbi:MAG: ABC transporter ATP-binding protein [Roseivirga sp.]|nr:ABC transporter ATP-binding protein [Roseivirga sp.]
MAKINLGNKLPYLRYFYGQLGYRVFVVMLTSLLVGILDGFGLAMFLPLLETVGSESPDSENLGNFSFLLDYLDSSGIGVSVMSILLSMMVFFILKGIAKFAESMYKVRVQQHFMKSIRYQSINGLEGYKYTSFISADAGRIQNTLTGETSRMKTAFHSFSMTIQGGALVFIYALFAFNANPEFTFFVAIGGGVTNLIFRGIYNRTKKLSRAYTTESNNFEGIIIQMVLFFKYLKATGEIGTYGRKLKRSVDQIQKDLLKFGFYDSVLKASREPLIVTVVVLIIGVQVTYFDQPMSGIVLSLLFFYRALTQLMVLQTNWNRFLETSGSLENMSALLKDLEDDKEVFGNEKFEKLNDDIRIEHLSFAYGEENVIEDINLTIKKNSTVAFVGESGSGKTTLANVIAGLLPPTGGNVFVNQISLIDVDTGAYRNRIGYITQDPAIFTDTIFNNVTLWSEKTEENVARFRRAIKDASLDNFIQNLGEGENTEIGNNGINLSGGQKQRISIARELYKNVDILILDEATSALDSATELEIKESIEALQGSYTIIMVAHRLSTIKSSDMVIVLQDGKLSAKGTYDSLVEENPEFCRMASLQQL